MKNLSFPEKRVKCCFTLTSGSEHFFIFSPLYGIKPACLSILYNRKEFSARVQAAKTEKNCVFSIIDLQKKQFMPYNYNHKTKNCIIL